MICAVPHAVTVKLVTVRPEFEKRARAAGRVASPETPASKFSPVTVKVFVSPWLIVEAETEEIEGRGKPRTGELSAGLSRPDAS